jgi:hypothetical protein
MARYINSLDLEIAAIASRAGPSVAQAEEDAAGAHRGRLAADAEAAEAERARAARAESELDALRRAAS